MQNQAAVEALYSATFVEDYLDTVENLPNELQRHLSSLRELDLMLYKDFLCDLDHLLESFERETTSSGQRQILAKIQKGLISAQDIGDDKLAVAQALADTIENRARLLEHGAKNLDFEDDDDEEEPPSKAPPTTAASAATNSGTKQMGGATGVRQGKRQNEDKGDKIGKRRKKQPIPDKHTPSRNEVDEDDSATPAKSTGTKSRGSTGGGGGGGGGGAVAASARKPAVKRKQTKKSNQDKTDNDSDRDVDLNTIDIDPDEPTYCLCEQVSYGDMIGCDNDLCPIEWFHFQCVQLTNKPKGKWYCPKCRGDKPTNMKPKAQFLKELEKFNKEREEKTMKQNG